MTDAADGNSGSTHVRRVCKAARRVPPKFRSPEALLTLQLAGLMMPSMGPTAAERLRELGVRGVLISAAEQGAIADLVCAMPECLCPEELGGRGYFEPKTQVLSDWMPTSDHYPVLKKDGGNLTVDNVRLAHRLCNRVDYSKAIGRPFEKDLARVEAARKEALRRMTR